MSKAKAKGTGVESSLVRYAIHEGMLAARRLALAGGKDNGDVELIPAIGDRGSVMAECKYTSTTVHLRKWVGELNMEVLNSGAETGLLVIKHPGAGGLSAWRWLAVFTQDGWGHMASLYRGDGLFPEASSVRRWVKESINDYVTFALSPSVSMSPDPMVSATSVSVRGVDVIAMPLRSALYAIRMVYPVLHP